MNEYQLRYLPQFHQDVAEIIWYISTKLKNPDAANHLVNAVENAILDRLPDAEIYEQYHSRKEHRYPYYRIYVGNYIVFYVVINEDGHKVMEIRRFLYAKSNWKRTI